MPPRGRGRKKKAAASPKRASPKRGAAAARSPSPPPPEEDHQVEDNDAVVEEPAAAAPPPEEEVEQQPVVEENNANDESMDAEEGEGPTAGSSKRSAARAPAANSRNAPPEDDASSQQEEEEDSVMKILLSTDNHLGYLERDAVRGNDSFAAFEEVLSLARLHKADMVLLSGDLFHDNKPSRMTLHKVRVIYCRVKDYFGWTTTYNFMHLTAHLILYFTPMTHNKNHKTMEILRRYCMGGESVGFQIISDQKECLRSLISGRANYEDEFYSVSIILWFYMHFDMNDIWWMPRTKYNCCVEVDGGLLFVLG